MPKMDVHVIKNHLTTVFYILNVQFVKWCCHISKHDIFHSVPNDTDQKKHFTDAEGTDLTITQ